MKHLDFYFDYISPYAYFAWFRIQELCDRRGLELRLHPVLFAGLLDHWGQLGPAEIPPKAEWTFKDCFRYAALHELEFRGPRAHPFNSLTALRVSLPEVAGDAQRQVVDALYRASWGRGVDLAAPDEVVQALDEAGLEGAALVAKTRAPEVKEALKQETTGAIAAGVFGVPTSIVDGELFWGNDRLEYLELFLDGRDPLNVEALRRFTSRPSGAVRPAGGRGQR